MHEKWAGVELEPTSVYGVRTYVRGSMLQNHTDRVETHIISSIINIDQKVDKPWPLKIYDNRGDWSDVFLEPGEILLYESGRCEHGREEPLEGDYFSNILIHYKPKGWYEEKRINFSNFFNNNQFVLQDLNFALLKSECNHIINLAKENLEPQTVISKNEDDGYRKLNTKIRKADGCFLKINDDKVLNKMKNITV